MTGALLLGFLALSPSMLAGPVSFLSFLAL